MEYKGYKIYHAQAIEYISTTDDYGKPVEAVSEECLDVQPWYFASGINMDDTLFSDLQALKDHIDATLSGGT